ERNGLSLGEAGGFALLERARPGDDALKPRGYGESSDAHHMSHPHPGGAGARLAMRAALARAGIDAADLDCLNLHGTAAPTKGPVAAAAAAAMFPATVTASSTTGWTGHTIGAAGIGESAVALLALREGFLPGSVGCDTPDPASAPQVSTEAGNSR